MVAFAIYLPLLLASIAHVNSLRGSVTDDMEPKFVTYDMWVKYCKRIVPELKQTYDAASSDVEKAGNPAKISMIKRSLSKFFVSVNSVEAKCTELDALVKDDDLSDGTPETILKLDKAARPFGRQMLAAVVQSHQDYVTYKVIYETEKVERDYLAAIKFVEKQVIAMIPCSSFYCIKRLVLLLPALITLCSFLL
ncbi:pleckstrin homology domain-containing family N member 1, putative [Babesia ovis]|uniref:Pleckstrin homology domain-containing family N member 1, putative n=1 Tax=Babesia ovis TaxID=5869 RepID=A0A9W5TCL3_BABOV|nr:pleckstrin homology domain-containing family N member 1, putative [Babesia ovis]